LSFEIFFFRCGVIREHRKIYMTIKIIVFLALVRRTVLAVDPSWVTVSSGVADGHLEPETYRPTKIAPKKPYIEFPSKWFGGVDDDGEDGNYVPSIVPHGFFEKQKYAAWLQSKTLFAVRKLKKWQEKHMELCSLCNSGIDFIEHAARVRLEEGQNPEDIARVTEPLSFTCDLMKESFPDMLSKVDCGTIHSRVMEKIQEALNPPLSDCEKEKLGSEQGPCSVTKRIALQLGGCGFLGAPAARACPKDGSSFEDTTALKMSQRVGELRDELQSLHSQLSPDLKAMRNQLKSSGKTVEAEKALIEDVRLENKMLTAELGNKRPVDIINNEEESDVLDALGIDMPTGGATGPGGSKLLEEINKGLSSDKENSSSFRDDVHAEKDFLKRLEKENRNLRHALEEDSSSGDPDLPASGDLEKLVHDSLGDRLESTIERVMEKIMKRHEGKNEFKKSSDRIRDLKKSQNKKTKELLRKVSKDVEDLDQDEELSGLI